MVLEKESISLDGKAAIVTGAAMGLGEAIALSLGRFGAALALCDRSTEELGRVAATASDLGTPVRSAGFDVRDRDDVDRFVSETAAHYGKIDVLVNNAGGTFAANFADVSENAERTLIDENWSSVSHFVRAALPHLAPGASIINITSIEAHRAGPGYAVYTAMKAAVTSLTKSLALELGDREIRVNCIAPDVIATPGLSGNREAGSDEPLFPPTPLTRTGHPDDVAGAALFLASDLSRFVTGTTIHVDGGNHAAGGWRRRAGGGYET